MAKQGLLRSTNLRPYVGHLESMAQLFLCGVWCCPTAVQHGGKMCSMADQWDKNSPLNQTPPSLKQTFIEAKVPEQRPFKPCYHGNQVNIKVTWCSKDPYMTSGGCTGIVLQRFQQDHAKSALSRDSCSPYIFNSCLFLTISVL